jgi:hypothetical protein
MYKDFLTLYNKAFLLAGPVGFNLVLVVLIIDLHEAVRLVLETSETKYLVGQRHIPEKQISKHG